MAGNAPASETEAFVHSRLYDLACAAPLILLYGFACAGTVILTVRQWPLAQGWSGWLVIVNEAGTLLFFGLQIVLFFLRRLPLRKSDGPWPRVTALLGANFNFLLLLLPRVTLDISWTAIATALTFAGTLASVAILVYLGRAFSIFPEARQLVLRGPYRYIRHPLYLFETVSILGIMLQYRQPWAAFVVIVGFCIQIRRMTYEEDVLRRTFPAYDAYAKPLARLIPGVY